MRKAIGVILLLFLFALLFALCAMVEGIKVALIIWGAALLFAFLIVFAVWLIDD